MEFQAGFVADGSVLLSAGLQSIDVLLIQVTSGYVNFRCIAENQINQE